MLAAALAAGGGGGGAAASAQEPSSRVFDLPAIVAAQAKAGEEWREFFRVKALSLGVYALKKGSVDTQSPHGQDEIYYVVSGRATLTVDGKPHPAQPGSVLYVAAGAKHRFHDITEDLTTLVFFAPAYVE
jgi:mannose-6-phosphate isomerase-like protein (cupin superfamily)